MKNHIVAGSGGTRLQVYEVGDRAGKSVLFVHGLSQCSVVWRKQMDSELAATYRLVAMDIRGHGLSDKPESAYGDSQVWADDVHAVIRSLDLDRPLLIGWSYAGAIISDYVRHYGEDEICGTNWIGAVCRLGEPAVAPGFLGEQFLEAVPGFFSNDVEESVRALRRLVDLCVPSGLSQEESYLLLGSNLVVAPRTRQALLSRNLDNDDVVSKMRKPMLLSWGDSDAVVSPKMRDHISGLAGHARVSTYAGVGHAPFWQAPERYNRELRDFLEQC